MRDGGGIKPDLEVKADSMPNIAYYLSVGDSTEVMFNYIVDYIAQHPTIGSDPTQFHLTEADYQEFRKRVVESGFTYDPVSRKQFDELVKTAKFEGYYEEAKEAFDQLSEKLNHNVATDLDKNRVTIMQMLELDIVSAYHYQRGSLRAGLVIDRQLKEAKQLLQNSSEYQKLLQPTK